MGQEHPGQTKAAGPWLEGLAPSPCRKRAGWMEELMCKAGQGADKYKTYSTSGLVRTHTGQVA